MSAVVIGASGLVGAAILDALGPGATGTYLTRPRPGLVPLDASDRAAVRRVLDAAHADVVFVPAAVPNVEWCELHPDEARERNLAPLRAVLAEADGARIVGFSSDYVFDGEHGPYAEDAPRMPLSVYGRIKAELEDLLRDRGHAVVRTTTVFGREAGPAKNFVVRLVDSLRNGERVRVPSDQISTPTYAADLARAAIRVAPHGGLWHIAGPDLMSRSELARRVADAFGLDASLIDAVPTELLGQAAPRPLRAGLRTERYRAAFGEPPVRPLAEALAALRKGSGG